VALRRERKNLGSSCAKLGQPKQRFRIVQQLESAKGRQTQLVQSTYALGCQNPDDPGLIMFTKPLGSTVPAPTLGTPLWTGNVTNIGRFADEYMACARTWGHLVRGDRGKTEKLSLSA
jgi:hypothetical protein